MKRASRQRITIATVVRHAVESLKLAGIENAIRDARVLMAAALDVRPDRITLLANDSIDELTISNFNQMVEKRCSHMPVSKIIGKRLFWGRSFGVSCDVLDPRGDTETLIETALKIPFKHCLDLGTGSGVIAITLLLEVAKATAVATDISDAAILQAQENAKSLGADKRLAFIKSDWFDQVDGTFDLIVSNPPYIGVDELPDLSPEVLNFDPLIALSPGADALMCYRIITKNAGQYLQEGGRLIVEIGYTQGASVKRLFEIAGFSKVEIVKDIDQNDRVVSGFWSK